MLEVRNMCEIPTYEMREKEKLGTKVVEEEEVFTM